MYWKNYLDMINQDWNPYIAMFLLIFQLFSSSPIEYFWNKLKELFLRYICLKSDGKTEKVSWNICFKSWMAKYKKI